MFLATAANFFVTSIGTNERDFQRGMAATLAWINAASGIWRSGSTSCAIASRPA
jgi:hypothetical protein